MLHPPIVFSQAWKSVVSFAADLGYLVYMNKLIRSLRHVGYVVEDLDASVAMFMKLSRPDGMPSRR